MKIMKISTKVAFH